MPRKKTESEPPTTPEVVNLENLQGLSGENHRQERERNIAEANQLLGKIQSSNMFGKLAVTATFVCFKKVKESKAYKYLPGIGTWDSFCESAGYSRRYVDEQLQNLNTFGEELLEIYRQFSLSHKDLRKLRQLNRDGSICVDEKVVVIGGESIPLDADHREDLQAAIEQLIETHDRILKDKEAVLNRQDRAIAEQESQLEKKEKEITGLKKRAERKRLSTGEEAFLAGLESDRAVIEERLLYYATDSENLLRDDLTPNMKAAVVETFGYFRRLAAGIHKDLQDLFDEPDDEDWDPEAEKIKANLDPNFSLNDM